MPVATVPPVRETLVVPLPQIFGVVTDTVPALGVPVQPDAATTVCVFDVASVPDNVAVPRLTFVSGVLAARPIVFPAVAPDAISAVICIYPEVPLAITGDEVNAGKVTAPAVPVVVYVETTVAVPVLNVEELEYQHLMLVTSAANE